MLNLYPVIDPYPLYIDPGTGSMLFSVLIGAAATLYFVARAVFIKIKVVFSGGLARADNCRNPFVIYCEGRQYISVFKKILDEFEKRGTEALYLSSAEDDEAFSAGYRYVKSEYIGEGNKAYARLNFLSAGVVLMTTPGLDVYQLKRSKTARHYAHILHAASDATMYRLFGLDYFDSVLLTGDYQAAGIRYLESKRGLPAKRLVTVGCTYLDLLAEKIRALPEEEKHKFTVLVSPSWGASALLSRFGEKLLDPLAATGWEIIVRPHPQSKKSEAAMLDRLAARYRDSARLSWDYGQDNIHSLAKADIMISDFSGIIFDYMFLCDRPVIYVAGGIDLRPYDADDVNHELWQFSVLKKAGLELREDMFANIKEVIQGVSDNGALRAARLEAKNEAWQHRNEAAVRVVDFMVSVNAGGASSRKEVSG